MSTHQKTLQILQRPRRRMQVQPHAFRQGQKLHACLHDLPYDPQGKKKRCCSHQKRNIGVYKRHRYLLMGIPRKVVFPLMTTGSMKKLGAKNISLSSKLSRRRM